MPELRTFVNYLCPIEGCEWHSGSYIKNHPKYGDALGHPELQRFREHYLQVHIKLDAEFPDPVRNEYESDVAR